VTAWDGLVVVGRSRDSTARAATPGNNVGARFDLASVQPTFFFSTPARYDFSRRESSRRATLNAATPRCVHRGHINTSVWLYRAGAFAERRGMVMYRALDRCTSPALVRIWAAPDGLGGGAAAKDPRNRARRAGAQALPADRLLGIDASLHLGPPIKRQGAFRESTARRRASQVESRG